jgi:hypothetical protein
MFGGPGDDDLDGREGIDSASGDDGFDTCLAETISTCES